MQLCNPPITSPIHHCSGTTFPTIGSVLSRDLQCFRILGGLGKVCRYRTYNRRDEVWDHNGQSRLLCLRVVRVTRVYRGMFRSLFGTQSCDPLNIKFGQACFVRIWMTAEVDDVFVIRHQREALNAF